MKKKSILITTGDADGIGFEVTAKALTQLPDNFFYKNNIVVFKSNCSEKKHNTTLKKIFHCIEFTSVPEYQNFKFLKPPSKKTIYVINQSTSPADWVFEAARLCMNSKNHSLVTAPISKELIIKSGYKEIGHTDILKTISGCKNLYMTFLGNKFNVLLLTGHIAFNQISHSIISFNDANFTAHLKRLLLMLPKSRSSKPIAIVGLNPHAGENNLIGKNEEAKLIKLLLNTKIHFKGPLVPDAAFLKKNWSLYSVYLCPYHDQGLIPFKMIHGHDSGIHLSLGLPFIRTSVDHGTAKDIFGKNVANANSMLSAIKWAIKLS